MSAGIYATKYEIGEYITLSQPLIKARITQIIIGFLGIEYKVEFWEGSENKFLYVTDNEIE